MAATAVARSSSVAADRSPAKSQPGSSTSHSTCSNRAACPTSPCRCCLTASSCSTEILSVASELAKPSTGASTLDCGPSKTRSGSSRSSRSIDCASAMAMFAGWRCASSDTRSVFRLRSQCAGTSILITSTSLLITTNSIRSTQSTCISRKRSRRSRNAGA
ncbi:hypothetical protein D9M68_620940 [compost metagenome]